MRKTLAHRRGRQILERETGFEPATSTLARSHSTTELLPLAVLDYSESLNKRANERVGERWLSLGGIWNAERAFSPALKPPLKNPSA